jgi:hypothetical protein
MTKAFLDLQDDLNEMKPQLNFLLRAFAALASESVDEGFRPTDWEAYQATMLGQDIIEKMVTRTEEAFKQHISKAG